VIASAIIVIAGVTVVIATPIIVIAAVTVVIATAISVIAGVTVVIATAIIVLAPAITFTRAVCSLRDPTSQWREVCRRWCRCVETRA
jgi:hypothetical protein